MAIYKVSFLVDRCDSSSEAMEIGRGMCGQDIVDIDWVSEDIEDDLDGWDTDG